MTDLTDIQAKRAKQIVALLAKAESTEFLPEAEALMAKAQELMAQHSIDEAMLNASRPHSAKSVPVNATIKIPGPYAKAKSSLLASVFQNNYCQVVARPRLNADQSLTCFTFGFESDMAGADVLYMHLLVLASRELLTERKKHPSVHGKSFAHAFYIGFAGRINERLKEARKAAEDEADSGSLLPALIDRKTAVDNLISDIIGKTRKSPGVRANHTGTQAGRAAGNRASLSSSLQGSRQALGR